MLNNVKHFFLTLQISRSSSSASILKIFLNFIQIFLPIHPDLGNDIYDVPGIKLSSFAHTYILTTHRKYAKHLKSIFPMRTTMLSSGFLIQTTLQGNIAIISVIYLYYLRPCRFTSLSYNAELLHLVVMTALKSCIEYKCAFSNILLYRTVVQCSTVQCSAVLCSAVQCSAVQCCTVQ